MILVLLGLGAAALVGRWVMKRPIANRPVQIGLLVVVAALGVWAAVALAGLDLGESAAEVPTMLFGLGAIGLVSEPRGVVYDIVNRQRLRQFQEAERRDEAATLAADDVACRRSAGMSADDDRASTVDAPLLAATDVTVRFGGVVALDR